MSVAVEIPVMDVRRGDVIDVGGRTAVVLELGQAGGWRQLHCGYVIVTILDTRTVSVVRAAAEVGRG